MTINDAAAGGPTKAPPFTFCGFEIPAGCRRIFITAALEPSSGDPRVQPTGFPDLGPVMYADPSGKDGLICLIESEASMANRLEEVCLDNKYEGTLRSELGTLPYIKLTDDGMPNGQFVTASTVDGHRFASEYIMNAQIVKEGTELTAVQNLKLSAEEKAPKKKTTKKKAQTPSDDATAPAPVKPEFVRFVQSFMGMKTKDRCPAANVPQVFRLAMEYDPLSLLHGFQISVKDKLTFVGLRSPRALTGSIIGLNCERIIVPGVRFDPIGTGDAGQAIFQKQRISAKRIEARFSIDVGLLGSMKLGDNSEENAARVHLLLKIALCKIAWFLSALKTGLRLRTECDLRLIDGGVQYWIDRISEQGKKFEYAAINEATVNLAGDLSNSKLASDRSPFVLKHPPKKDAAKPSEDTNAGQVPDSEEDEDGGQSDED